ncbi:Glycosyltransferase [Psidium guajava]|nr:Glycosyltransferase [Psidium guajava]
MAFLLKTGLMALCFFVSVMAAAAQYSDSPPDTDSNKMPPGMYMAPMPTASNGLFMLPSVAVGLLALIVSFVVGERV